MRSKNHSLDKVYIFDFRRNPCKENAQQICFDKAAQLKDKKLSDLPLFLLPGIRILLGACIFFNNGNFKIPAAVNSLLPWCGIVDHYNQDKVLQ